MVEEPLMNCDDGVPHKDDSAAEDVDMCSEEPLNDQISDMYGGDQEPDDCSKQQDVIDVNLEDLDDTTMYFDQEMDETCYDQEEDLCVIFLYVG